MRLRRDIRLRFGMSSPSLFLSFHRTPITSFMWKLNQPGVARRVNQKIGSP